MSQNKRQSNQHRNCSGNCQHHKQDGFCSAIVHIEKHPTVTVPLDEYEMLIRISERAEIVVGYVLDCDYGVSKKAILGILGADEPKKGGEES